MAEAANRELAKQARLLRSLHEPGDPLVLPNAWDAASAAAVEAAGFAVVATGSAAVADALGYADHEAAPVDEMFAAAARIAAAVSVPVTVDLESGYGLPATELVDRLLAAGAVGCNLEDTSHRDGGLSDVDAQAAWLAEVRSAASAAGVDVVVDARTDVFVRQVGEPEERVDEAVRRGRAYLGAGADCVYPILVDREETIARLVDGMGGPVNVLAGPHAPSLARLAGIGVARVSYGPRLHRLAQSYLADLLARVGRGESPWPAS
ncbi:MAG: isocitrate lyase/phosphoenolpyruvate mutase family protein [Acidothermales bacterium]|nr:isocitrate lyase/phosphoenolpyruvate mutase family protein [Acidothermales bacterium]